MISLNENGTVCLAGLQPEMDVAMYVVDSVLSGYGIPTVITAGTEEFYPDGTLIHSIGSYHPRGDALDFRDRQIPREDYNHIINDIQRALRKINKAYDVVREGNHFHVEFDLKKEWQNG